jgi:murein DD-endopeptidase MepM/ murein hydrolase activator NlpD
MYRDQITTEITLPATAPSVSQQFWRLPDGMYDREGRREHLGIDITAAKGTPVLAAATGQVIASFYTPAYGHQVTIDHGGGFRTGYWHLNSRRVEVGDTVKRGQLLGGLGKTGLMASNTLHVHFVVMKRAAGGRFLPVDPSAYWTGGPGRVECFDPKRHWSDRPFKVTYPVLCRPG